MDWDKNGSVSFVEFKSYLSKLKKGEAFDHQEALQAFKSIDSDGSKQLTWEEFFVSSRIFQAKIIFGAKIQNCIFQDAMTQVAANQNTSSMNDDELTKVFNEIDDDGNGYITPREAKKAFRKLADKFNISRVSHLLKSPS